MKTKGMMMTNSPQQQQDSSLSRPMEASLHSDGILALGRRLVDELTLEPTDTLGRWMAQYVAELMEAVSTVPLPERSAAQDRCFKAILELWSYRAELPDGKRPLAEMEPVVRAIESLDPDAERPRYYGEPNIKGKSAQLLEFAKNLDASARSLIRFLLSEAAAIGVGKSSDWLVAAEAAGMDSGVHEIVMHFLIDLQVETYPDLDRRQRKVLTDRIERLEAFANATRLISAHMRSRLGVPKTGGEETEDTENGDAPETEDDAETEDAENDGDLGAENKDEAENDEAD